MCLPHLFNNFIASIKRSDMRLYERQRYSDGQLLFGRTLFAVAFAIKFFFKIWVYSPLLLLGWLITKQIVTADAEKILSIALILLFAFAFYFTVYFLKGAIIALKDNDNLLCIP